MSMIPVCVGFDYHDDSIRICVMSQSGQTLMNRSVANSVELVIHAVSRFARVAGARWKLARRGRLRPPVVAAHGVDGAAGTSGLCPAAQAESRQERS